MRLLRLVAPAYTRRSIEREERMSVRWAAFLGISVALVLTLGADESADNIAALRAAAAKGDAAKQYELSQRYQYGHGVAKDDVEALKWLRQAAEGGSASAQYDLGFRYHLGEGIVEDDAQALAWYRRAAEKKHAGAQNNLGEMYFKGKSVPKDCAEAAKWFRLAAAQEDPRASFHLGVLHATGCGLPQNDAEAVSWYRRAAEGWHDDAEVQLGTMYYSGRGVKKDTTEAVKWFRRSWHPRTATTLFLRGMDSRSDAALAYFWFGAAVAEGEARAQRSLEDAQGRMNPAQLAEARTLLAEWQKTSRPSLEEWVYLLGTPYPDLSKEAESRVRDAGPEAAPVLAAALRTASHGPHILELSEAVRRIGPPAKEAVPSLEAILTSRPPTDIYRPFVASALASVDPERGKAHVPELERCSTDPKFRSWVRMTCVMALDSVESPSVTTRIALLKDEDADLRAMAADGLRKGPADTVRAPLEAALRDPVLEVRVRAASSLLRALPKPPAMALTALLEGVCKGTNYDADTVAFTLDYVPREVALQAVEPLTTLVGSIDPKCRTWAAIALGRVDRQRALPVLGLLREALASEDAVLRRAAAGTLGSMGPSAREALADLERAAQKDPDLAFMRDKLKARPLGLQGLKLQEVVLVALGKHEAANAAYLLHESGSLWGIKNGQRLFDGVIERVSPDGLDFRDEAGAQTSLKLFKKGDPAPLAAGKEFSGEPLSIDLDADVTSLASLMAQFSGLNIVLEAGTSGRVRIAARHAPWDGILETALQTGGFASRVDRSFLRIGRRDQIDKLRPLSSTKTWGAPVTLAISNADMRDLALLFKDIAGLPVELPNRPYEPVTVFVTDVPWDQALDVIVASLGLTYRVDGDRIRVEAPPGR
jgi:TPR repeat protein/HEAT repeat protein